MSQNENGRIAASIFGSIASVIISNNERQNHREEFARNVYDHGNYGYHNRGHDRPVYPIYRERYQPIEQIIQASISRDCWGNGDYGSRVRDQYRNNSDSYRNCPRHIPNWGNRDWNRGSCLPTTQNNPYPYPYPTTTYPTTTYPTSQYNRGVIAYGNGRPQGSVQIAGRELKIDQNGMIESFDSYGMKLRSFSVQGFNGFTLAEQNRLRSGQTVELPLGDDSKGVITFYPSADRSRIEGLEMRNGNQYSYTGNISGARPGGLAIPNSQDEFNPYQTNPNQPVSV
jgi:hypothetical protein